MKILSLLIFLLLTVNALGQDEIREIKEDYKLPALAYSVMKDGKIIATESYGIRSVDSDIQITENDLFHIGSCTKSMTATLAAILVQEGKLSWDITLGNVFADIAIHEDYKNVTLVQLLSHTAGTTKSLAEKHNQFWVELWGIQLNAIESREHVTKYILEFEPEYSPGIQYVYSNTGYIIAGAIIDRVMNRSFEDLLFEKLLTPLGIESAGWGPAGTEGQLDQPLGHNWELKPFYIDNPLALNSAGRLHLSVADFMKYVNFHMVGHNQGHDLLDKEHFIKMHTVVKDSYGLGWIIVDRPWADGIAITHSGSNTFNFAVMWIAPNKDFALVVMTNVGYAVAMEPCDKIAGILINKYL